VPKGSFQVTRTDDALEVQVGPAVGSRVGLFWLWFSFLIPLVKRLSKLFPWIEVAPLRSDPR
jgi:hypothetical protein